MGRAADRDERIDRLLAGAFDRDLPGRWLVSGVLPQVEERLRAGGAEVVHWRRFAVGTEPGSPGPVGDGYAGAVVRLPRGSAATDLTLNLVAARLMPDGELWVGGANDEGIRAVERRLGEVMVEVGEGTSGGHGRRIGGRGPRPDVRGDLEDWASDVVVEVGGTAETLASWPGLFAHGHLDEGTALLLAHLPEVRGRSALDFACGVGIVAHTLVRRGATVQASDHDALAVHATRRNVPAAVVQCLDGVPAGSWDLIVSNPPIHRGVESDWSVLTGLAEVLPRRLRPGGSAWIVTQVTVPVRTLFAGMVATRVATDQRFTVWRLTSS